MRRRHLLAVVVVLAVVLAGCSGAGNGGDSADVSYGGQSGGAATGAPESTASGDSGGSGGGASDAIQAKVRNRQLIYTAEVTLRVDDYDAARERLTRTVRRRGGYVGDATRRVRGSGNDTWVEGTLTLRVPSGNYSAAMTAVNGTGTVVSSAERTSDVTDQVVDLRARLKSLRAERDRLRELYRQANDTEDVLAVQRELSDVQTEIERTEARLRGLERRVAYSTITVQLREPRPDYTPPERRQFYETPLTEAFLESVHGVVVVVRSLVVFSAYALPYALLVGVPAAVVALLYVRGPDLV
jgi:predicted small secreted protein/cell division protein FtsB